MKRYQRFVEMYYNGDYELADLDKELSQFMRWYNHIIKGGK